MGSSPGRGKGLKINLKNLYIFIPVSFQCRLSYGVRKAAPCAIACVNICAHVKKSQTLAAIPLFGHTKIPSTLIRRVALLLWLLCPTRVRRLEFPAKDNEPLTIYFILFYFVIVHDGDDNEKIILAMVMIMMMVKFIIFPERSSRKMAVGRGGGGRGERGARGGGRNRQINTGMIKSA